MNQKRPAGPPDRRPVFFIAAATAFSLLGDQVLYAVLPVYYTELGITGLQVGVLLAANRIVRLATNALAHRLSDIVPQRPLLLAAFVLGVLTTAAYVFTSLFSVLLVARLAWGLSWSFIRHYGVQSVMYDVPVSEAGWTMGLMNGISRAGSAAGLFGGALLVDLLGFSTGMLTLAVLSLPAVWLAGIGFRTFPASEPGAPTIAGSGLNWQGFTLGMVGPGLVMATLGASLGEYVTEDGWMSAATLTGALLAVRYVLDSVAAPWLGAVTDRLGLPVAASLFFGIGGLSLIVAAAGLVWWLFTAAVMLFFVAGTALQAGVAGTASMRRSAAYARYVTANDLGSALGPLLGWWLIDLYAEPGLALVAGGVAYLVNIPFTAAWRSSGTLGR
ncbi:MAG: MFS transporter [Pseudomonadales bacterium]|nr:MFS transporter [Pseudomonadales bacterium]MDP6470312.1 MFS transporter [Pseudomonadales bacterium]MDP6827218.1 MFS transporter [Pseudomonadales bacterium]MDP6972480.1 MFS transporter [Pseudomonadales bacterium]